MSSTLLEAPRTFTPVAKAPVSILDLTDEHLMEQIRAQDPDALGVLHDRYSTMIKALVMKVLHNDAESDDMVQEIYVEIWNRAGSYDREKGKALGWIITLARRRAIDRLRKREAYCRAEERLLEHSRQTPTEGILHVEEDLAHAEMREHLQRVLATLPPAQKQAIELAFYRGLSQREIAAHTGIPLGTVKTRLELGLKKVAEALKGFEDLL
ncbi:MAG: sigma-70 family RNA polymerase sigma factor [Verrucomicrobiaceae bacterium]|nr:MAG: sigma-70 family RNA polymerase sigma factor [Verrucomicrobiaceae bacterium]